MNRKMKIFTLLLLCITMASVVFAAEGHKTLDGDVEATYYGDNTEVGQSGYCFSFQIDDESYYLDDAGFKLVIEDDSNRANANQLEQYQQQVQDDSGLATYTMTWNNTDISFDYEDGHTVGNDTNANVITHVYDSNGVDLLNQANTNTDNNDIE